MLDDVKFSGLVRPSEVQKFVPVRLVRWWYSALSDRPAEWMLEGVTFDRRLGRRHSGTTQRPTGKINTG